MFHWKFWELRTNKNWENARQCIEGIYFLNFKIVELSTLAGFSIFSIILNFRWKYSGSLGGKRAGGPGSNPGRCNFSTSLYLITIFTQFPNDQQTPCVVKYYPIQLILSTGFLTNVTQIPYRKGALEIRLFWTKFNSLHTTITIRCTAAKSITDFLISRWPKHRQGYHFKLFSKLSWSSLSDLNSSLPIYMRW